MSPDAPANLMSASDHHIIDLDPKMVHRALGSTVS